MDNKSNVLRSIVIGCLFFFSFAFLTASVQAQTPAPRSDASVKLAADTQKAREQIAKIGSGNEITIVRRDGQEFYGSVLKIDDDSVIVNDADLKANVEIPYQQIVKVSKGYGHSRAWNGKRIPPRKHLIGLIIAAAVAIILPIIVVASIKD